MTSDINMRYDMPREWEKIVMLDVAFHNNIYTLKNFVTDISTVLQ